MKKIGTILVFAICFFAAEMAESDKIQRELQENLLRLHIIANSDSERDRQVKLAVRDGLIELGDYNTERLKTRADDVLKEEAAGYTANVCYRKRHVPKKIYKNIVLPEGIYTCIDVVLGRGEGEHWWCIAYPPLCFSEAVSGEMSEEAKELLKTRLSAESLETILKDEKITYKFKILEELQKIMRFLK